MAVKKSKNLKSAVNGDDPIGDSPSLVMEPLSDREDWFCREYVADAAENATEAYSRVFKAIRSTSSVEGCRLLKKPNIRARINELREDRAKRLGVSSDAVLAGIAKLAFYDVRNLFDSDGRIKPIDELDPDLSSVISGIETMHKVTGDDKDGMCVITKIKLADRGQNLERLGRHLKLFTDNIRVSGNLLLETLVTDEEVTE